MDYATSPVKGASNSQSQFAGARPANSSGSGLLGFNGLLQNASVSSPAGAAASQGSARPTAEGATGAGSGLSMTGSAGADSEAAKPAANDDVLTPIDENITAQAAVGSLTAGKGNPGGAGAGQAISLADLSAPADGEGKLNSATVLNPGSGTVANNISSALADNMEAAKSSGQVESALLSSGKPEAAGGLSNLIAGVNGLKGTERRTAAGVPGLGSGSATAAAMGSLETKSTLPGSVAADAADAAVTQITPARNALAKSDLTEGRFAVNGDQPGAGTGILHNQRGGLSSSGNPVVLDPRLVNAQSNLQMGAPAANEVNAATVLPVSAAISSSAVAQGLIARQHGRATNDQSVSQIARGGKEARLAEINSLTTANASPPVRAPITAAAEVDAEVVVKQTNMIAAVVAKNDKSLRAMAATGGAQELVTRTPAVDAAVATNVEFGTITVDSVAGSQAVSRVAILEPGWTNQLGSDLRMLAMRGNSTTQVQVTPADLGPLDIEVSVNRQELSVRIVAMHGQTREMLEAALPRLREFLSQQNYTSVDVSVGGGSGNSSSSAFAQSHQGGGQTAGSTTLPGSGGDLNGSGSGQASDTDLLDTTARNRGLTGDDASVDDSDNSGVPPLNTYIPGRGLVDAYA